ncbi:hypothetical protein LL912_05700 [Niabella sp. CC-SYL272]|uniref:hypothetical protein n=1 Tax=Niabella agricola TaxID=2891571 RepID=UPI001F3092D9|nr:hypothetical protein [Niabella agricola]MCF3108266.1 hypothetical protein [Niabella agricola]
MKKILLPVVITALFIFGACNSRRPAQTETGAENNELPDGAAIPFTRATHYFVRNDFREGQLEDSRITTKARFDSIFGTAATMGRDGQPTPIDFTKQDVIAVIDSVSDNAVSYENLSLRKDGGYLALSYDLTKGAKQSFSTRPFLLLVIDKKYKQTVIPVIKK